MITVILAALLGCSTTETATAPVATEAATTPTAVEVTPATTTTTEDSTTCVDITDDGTDQCAQPVVVTSPTGTDSTTSTGTSVTPVSSATTAHQSALTEEFKCQRESDDTD